MKSPARNSRVLLAMVVVFTLPLLAAVSEQQPRKPTWMILVHGHADHNLSCQMVTDLPKMEPWGSASGFTIVQADFDANAEQENEDEGLPHKLTRRTGRFLVTKSTNPDRALTILDGAEDNTAPAPVKVRPGGKIIPA
jgi:hypothetical protein